MYPLKLSKIIVIHVGNLNKNSWLNAGLHIRFEEDNMKVRTKLKKKKKSVAKELIRGASPFVLKIKIKCNVRY